GDQVDETVIRGRSRQRAAGGPQRGSDQGTAHGRGERHVAALAESGRSEHLGKSQEHGEADAGVPGDGEAVPQVEIGVVSGRQHGDGSERAARLHGADTLA
ncbi:MAG: hypothetical protein JWM18_1881, partial [Chloroflexi bacterium]|nr:hypothetical protein [Chloroflexota bacterium]